MTPLDVSVVPASEKCPFDQCGGSPAGSIGGVCMMCLAYSRVPLELALEDNDADDLSVNVSYVYEVLDALQKFEAEIHRLRAENERLTESVRFVSDFSREARP